MPPPQRVVLRTKRREDQILARSGFVSPAKAGVPEVAERWHNGQDMQPCVYILASRKNGTLYVGVTSDPLRRIWEHEAHVVDGFTKRYGVLILVYAELHATMTEATLRENRIKQWRRAWKIQLIERANPTWRDLYDEIVG